MKTIMTRNGDTLGELTWRLLGRDDDVIENEVYELNPHLHALPLVLPAGITIRLPEVKKAEPKERTGVWS